MKRWGASVVVAVAAVAAPGPARAAPERPVLDRVVVGAATYELRATTLVRRTRRTRRTWTLPARVSGAVDLAANARGDVVIGWHVARECDDDAMQHTLPCDGHVRALTLVRGRRPTAVQELATDLPNLDAPLQAAVTPAGEAVVAWGLGGDPYGPDPYAFRVATARVGSAFTLVPGPRRGVLRSVAVDDGVVRLRWTSARSLDRVASGRVVAGRLVAD